MNCTQLIGFVLSINVPKGARYGEIVIQYGNRRKEKKGAPLQYINAVKVKVPEKVIDRLQNIKENDIVEVLARAQGVLYQGSSEGPILTTELVASAIMPWGLSTEVLKHHRKEHQQAEVETQTSSVTEEEPAIA